MKTRLASVVVAISSLLGAAEAQTFTYDNGGPDFFNSRVNDPRFPVFINYADNFFLPTDLALTSITWYGAYKDGNGLPDGSDNFRVSIFAATGGGTSFSPSPVFNGYLTSVSRELAANPFPFGPVAFKYSAGLPGVDLVQGTYLISIRNEDRSDNDLWLWLGHRFSPGEVSYYQSSVGGPWGEGQGELAFSLTGAPLTPVPEPSTYGLMGSLVLGGILLLRTGRSRRSERK